jgi:hypothetical protein
MAYAGFRFHSAAQADSGNGLRHLTCENPPLRPAVKLERAGSALALLERSAEWPRGLEAVEQ